MHQLTITIGRGASDAPNYIDDAARWLEFQSDADALVRRHGYEIVGQWWGVGIWEGKAEQNYHVGGVASRAQAVGVLVREVGELAHVYNQDAIALGTGTSVLVDREGNIS